MIAVHAAEPQRSAILAVSDLLTRLRLDFAFVGDVARAAWLGTRVESRSVDVLALMTSEQKGQVAMMAANRGFGVDRDEVERTAELDLIPLHFPPEDASVRIHVLVASNALYGQMVVRAVPAVSGDRELRVLSAEDLALLLSMAEDQESLDARARLLADARFDRESFNQRLQSIGLGGMVAG